MDNHERDNVLNELIKAVSDLENIPQNVHISDYFRPLQNALQNIHMLIINSESEGEELDEDSTGFGLISLEHSLQRLNNGTSASPRGGRASDSPQHGGGNMNQEHGERVEQSQPGSAASATPPPPPPSETSGPQFPAHSTSDHEPPRQRENFNVTEIRRPFVVTPPTPGNVPDLALFYASVMHMLMELADAARGLAGRGDVVQLELAGGGFSHHVIIPVGDENDDSFLPAFTDFLDDVVQSNAELPENNNLELILQVVRNPSGGVKRRLEKTLDCELINKKKRHLYLVNNAENQLCFSISLAHVNNPCLTDSEAAVQGEQWQLMAGLTVDTPVNFCDINKFERIVKRKIVVFYRKGENNLLCKFETDFPDRSNPLFLFLMGNHYYGIRNLTGFTGAKYTCSYCYIGYDRPESHSCEGFCPICHDPGCHLRPLRSVQCAECNRICHDSICFDKHREPRLRPRLEKFRSHCETSKFCLICKRLYHVPGSREHFIHECSVKCRVCGEKLPCDVDVTLNEHQCFIQPCLTDEGLDDKLVFYDFESFSNQSGVHVPFLANLNYSGAYPPPSCYAAELMNPAERLRFDVWYNEASKGSFDFQKEALHYSLHTATLERERALQFVYGLDLQIMWEHDWLEMKSTHSGVINFLQSFSTPTPLCPREALYGGRTCPLRMRYTAGDCETVHYVDFTSLYPYVNCSFPYPLGHPKIIYKGFDDPRNYYGFIRATVYPPRGLYFPVLPHKTSAGKLVFTLCRACAEINNQEGPCSHSDQERALTGVWVTAEFSKALNMGYRTAKITEVWHFEKQSSTIFKDYIHTFLKGKQEASGYPADAADEESRLKYIEDYRVNQGIRLNPDKIEVNPAKRQVAKLCLNSFWGKFAQRKDLPQTTIVSKPEEFFNFMFSGV
ncbi:uncharacterized protein ACNS7B_002119 [Menidia menidia]